MLRNYLKIALRTLRRRRSYALLNVGGLAVGLAAVLLIGLWVQDELSYDDFHENADRTYRVLRGFDMPDLEATLPATPSALAPVLEENVPGVEQVVRTVGGFVNELVVRRGAKQFVEDGVLWAGDGFFEVFSFPLKRGKTALDRPGTVLLTEAMAQKYFPGEAPIGQTLKIGEHALEVTGVLRDVPSNSSLSFGFVASLETRGPELSWGANDYVTYVLLEEGVSKAEAMPRVAEAVQAGFPRPEEAEGEAFVPYLQPLTGIHFGQGVPVSIESVPGGGSQNNILYVYLFAALAGFVLVLACINFTNLATARSTERAGEVGMRKALGAQREQLAGQFLGEALLLSSAATLLAVLLARMGVPLLNALSGKELALGPMLRGPWVLALPALAVVVGLVAGAWPALALSRFQPAEVLRGTFGKGQGGRRFRQGLVVFQFAVTIAVLIGAAVVYQQLSFMRSAGLGFEEENVVVVQNTDALGSQIGAFMQEIERLPGVEGKAASSYAMPGDFFWNGTIQPTAPDVKSQNMNYTSVGWGYTEALGIEMAAGRRFSPERTDSSAVVINEAAARGFGWTPQEAVGKKLDIGNGLTIAGVTENFHYESLHEQIYPLLLYPPLREQQRVAIRLAGEDLPATLASVGATWEEFSDLPFNYSFLADDLAAQYEAERRMARVFAAGALLAVLVACLGLFGLAAFTAERRTKEIAVRKALGASVTSIVGLLSKDFLKLVAVGFALAVPLAWYGMRQWLSSFAYHAELGPFVFVAAGALALLVALATVSWQALRAARLNPADALRDE